MNKDFLTVESEKQIFVPFSIRDIVFLSIVAAITIAASAVMPLVSGLTMTVFGIAQLVTSFQISLFFAIGVYKVRKTGALFFVAFFVGIIQVMMAPLMFYTTLVNAIFIELLMIICFRGLKKKLAVFFAVSLFSPLSLPFSYLFSSYFTNSKLAPVTNKNIWQVVLISLAIVLISVIGTVIGMKISKELEKAGVMKR